MSLADNGAQVVRLINSTKERHVYAIVFSGDSGLTQTNLKNYVNEGLGGRVLAKIGTRAAESIRERYRRQVGFLPAYLVATNRALQDFQALVAQFSKEIKPEIGMKCPETVQEGGEIVAKAGITIDHKLLQKLVIMKKNFSLTARLVGRIK